MSLKPFSFVRRGEFSFAGDFDRPFVVLGGFFVGDLAAFSTVAFGLSDNSSMIAMMMYIDAHARPAGTRPLETSSGVIKTARPPRRVRTTPTYCGWRRWTLKGKLRAPRDGAAELEAIVDAVVADCRVHCDVEPLTNEQVQREERVAVDWRAEDRRVHARPALANVGAETAHLPEFAEDLGVGEDVDGVRAEQAQRQLLDSAVNRLG